jgi:hypothetical protein
MRACVRLGLLGPAALAPLAPLAASGQEAGPSAWAVEKCARYAEATERAFARIGTGGIGSAFLEAHAAFIDGGCAGPRAVCPRTAEEIAMANTLTVLAMNAGAASTFLPFGCPR